MNKLNKDKYNKSELFRNIYPFIKASTHGPRSKDVLDIGCIEHDAKARQENPFWVHEFLKDNCRQSLNGHSPSNVLGIDILKEDVKTLCSKGYNIKVADAETFELDKKFDVIFAGELIEHLGNPTLFLQQSRKHLRKDGYLILTTPNTFYLPRILKCVSKMDDDPIVNKEHTVWFSPSTLRTLLSREGFEVSYIKRFDATAPKGTFRSRVKNILNKNIKGSLLVIAKLKQ